MAKMHLWIVVTLFITNIINVILAEKGHVHDQDFSDDNQKAIYSSPVVTGFAYLAEHFDNHERFNAVWIKSEAKKKEIDESIAKYNGIWAVEAPAKNIQEGDFGLVLKSAATHAAIATYLNKPFIFEDKPLIVQYEVNFQEGQECGGAYLKLLSHDQDHRDLKNFHDKTPYTIMFGPDKCGNDHKLHFIFRHKNPKNGSIEEKHCKKPKDRLEEVFKDKIPHLYTLIVHPTNNFQIKVDNKIVNEGSLLDDFTPPVNPPLEIEDPDDKKPDDWDEREKIPDPTAIKPEDWNEDAPAQIIDEDDTMPDGWLEEEPPSIPNADALKPDDWDVEMDGEWEPPQIPNPKCQDVPGCGPYQQSMKKNPLYKGKWSAPLINNPNYKGKWKPRFIPNPHYFDDQNPFKMTPIVALGFELWSVSPNILFDNLIITDDENVAKKWADDSFEIHRQRIEKDSATVWGRMMRSMNHKPGWWAAYFIYCAIPIILYIWYLYRRSQEWSVWRQFVNFTSEHPWIWAVYILVAGIPVLILIYCCCFPSQDKLENLESKELLITEEELNEPTNGSNVEENETVQQENLNDADEDVENINETDKIVDSDKEQPSCEEDGPRRRKLNKE